MNNRVMGVMAVCMCMFWTSGCMMMRLKEDMVAFESYKKISGKVLVGKSTLPVAVVLWGLGDAEESVSDYRVAPRDGSFEFETNKGRFYLIAFEDANEDCHFQEQTERTEIYQNAEVIDLSSSKSYENLVIELLPPGKAQLPADVLARSAEDAVSKFEKRMLKVGQVTTMDNPAFSAENASIGLWTPLTYMETLGMNLYFLEPYDAKKTPVLFVHGANGQPGDFRTLIDQLDRTHFQPWVLFYPSGARLDTLGGYVAGMLRDACLYFPFEEIIMVAHSMGGLVSRSAILHYQDTVGRAQIPVYITFSTPWNGHSAVAMGVDHAPAVVPSWYDMLPGNPFIAGLFEQSLPAETKHHLFFGFEGKGGSPFADENTDGAVSIKSQLSIPAQSQANSLTGVAADHVGILSDPFALERFNAILQQYVEQK